MCTHSRMYKCVLCVILYACMLFLYMFVCMYECMIIFVVMSYKKLDKK